MVARFDNRRIHARDLDDKHTSKSVTALHGFGASPGVQGAPGNLMHLPCIDKQNMCSLFTDGDDSTG